MAVKYKRVLVKLSGEALAGEEKFGVNPDMTRKIAEEIKEIHDEGVEIAVVVGGGNFFRGRTGEGIERATADYMGMLATVMNSLALQDALLKTGCDTKVMTAIEMRDLAEGYSRRRALDYLSEGKIVIFGAGLGSPYFSTDTAAALRAIEMNAEIILFAKNVDAVYSADPNEDPNATRYDKLTFMDVIEKDLKVMDLTAATLCKDNGIKIHVFGLAEEGSLKKAVNGENIGTLIY